MSHSNCEKLICEFCDEYLLKLFYFCLKRTGNENEAQDLSQDIALNVIAALNKGTVPESFSAWVWRIARNRYSVWADTKRRHAEAVTGDGFDENEPADDSADALDKLIRAEQLSVLRRELAFVRADYRDIVVAYYIKDMSVRDIAKALSLSEDAVKQRLHRARIMLKEGMNMAREFGKMSYSPENIAYTMCGMNGNDGAPWCYLERLICKNIMLAAYRNPSTAEELAIETGVALPYVEEELGSLVASTLMKKSGDKYQTNYFIVSKEAQERIYGDLRSCSDELTSAVIDIVEYEKEWKDKNNPGWHEGYQPYEDMKWALLMIEADKVADSAAKPYYIKKSEIPDCIGPWGFIKRPNGGEWDVLGLEICESASGFIGLHGCTASPAEKELPEVFFRQFKFSYRNICDKTPNVITNADGRGLVSVANGDISSVDEAVRKRLEGYGYIEKTEDGYKPTFLVMYKDKNPILTGDEKLNKLQEKAVEIARRHYVFCREQILGEIPDFLKDDKYQIRFACRNIFNVRKAVFEGAMKRGYISYAENDDRRMLGAYLMI